MNTHQAPANSELMIAISGRQFGTDTFLLINKNVVLKAAVYCTSLENLPSFSHKIVHRCTSSIPGFFFFFNYWMNVFYVWTRYG